MFKTKLKVKILKQKISTIIINTKKIYINEHYNVTVH